MVWRPLDHAYLPLSVREGGRRRRLRWWLSCQREAAAFWLAPWLRQTCQAAMDRQAELETFEGFGDLLLTRVVPAGWRCEVRMIPPVKEAA